SKEEIERMLKDAEAHAEEDAKRRAEIDARNTGEQLVYSTEKFLTDSGDKVSDDLKAPVTTALEDLKAALQPESGASAEDINAKIDTLNTESQKMGAAVYAAAAEQGESGDVPGGEAGDADFGGADSGAGAGDDDVVDAEVVEDDEETK
ncbi:MAG: Hsp70 family protein, partial [Actinomycetia bacterium]|nr:Hsp70 family protein [Actinomycetes bacterium]